MPLQRSSGRHAAAPSKRSSGKRSAARALPLALLLCALFLSACDDFEDGFSDLLFGTDTELGPGLVNSMTSDGSTVWLATSGLASFTSTITALNASGEELWSTLWPGAGADIMLGGDDCIYVSTSSGVSALDRSGRRLSFDGASRGQMSWHPWGLVMTWGEGFAILDAFGNELHSSFEDVRVHSVAAAPDGDVYALVTVTEEDGIGGSESSDFLWKLNGRLDEVRWWVSMENTAGIANHEAPPSLAVHEDYVVFALGGFINAWTHDMEFLWGATRVSGPLLIDAEGTTYVGGAVRTAIDRDGEILWDIAGRSELVLTRDGLGMVGIYTTSAGQGLSAVGRVDRSTGEFTAEATFGTSSDFIAPVVVGGRLFAAAHVIETSQGMVGDDLVVGQGARAFTLVGPPATRGAAWHEARGPGNRGLLRTRAALPDAEHLRGTWVAHREGYVRALQFTDHALNFGLAATRAYGIWDFPLHEAPRLVQVGTWEVRDDEVTLSPQEDLAGARGRTTLRTRASEPGLLDIDDPLQRVRRTFVRTGRIPSVATLARPAEIGWIDESGANRAEFTGFNTAIPTDEGDLWVVGTYAGTGHIGPWQFRPTHVTTNARGDVTSTISHTMIAKHRADGSWERVYHLEVDRGPGNAIFRPENGGLVLSGAVAVGVRPEERQELLRLRLMPSGEEDMTLSGTEPWPEHERDGEILHHGRAQVLHELPGGDLLFLGIRTAPETTVFLPDTYRSTLFRLSASGALQWELALDPQADEAMLHSATVSEADGSIYVVGSSKIPLDLDDAVEPLEAWGSDRVFVARVDLDEGRVRALRGLGGGGELLYPVAALPQGGFAMLANTRFDPPFNAGVGGPLRNPERGSSVTLLSFDRDLDAQWASTIESPILSGQRVQGEPQSMEGLVQPRGLRALSDSSIVLFGASEGRLIVGGDEVGMQGRRAPILHFDPCGNLLPLRRFASRVTVEDVREASESRLVATGAYESDIIEPPHIIPWPGRLPTPNEPVGNANGLLLTLDRSPDEVLLEPQACTPTPLGRSLLRVEFPGPGKGRVVSTPAGIDCPGTCTAEFDDLTEIRLVATPESGHRFAHFAHQGASMNRCTSREDCEILLLDDAVVEVRFDNADFAWAEPIPLSFHPVDSLIQQAGDRIAVRGTAEGSIATSQGTYDPALRGASVLAFVSESGVERVLPLTPSQTWDGWAAHETGWVFATYTRGVLQALIPEASLEANDYLVAFGPDDELRWYQPIHRQTSSGTIEIGLQHDRVALLWLAATTVRLGDEEAFAANAALAVFSLEEGELLGLNVEDIVAVREIGPMGREGFLLQPSAGAVSSPFVELDGRGALVRQFAAGNIFTTRVAAQTETGRIGGFHVDDDGIVRWEVGQGYHTAFDASGAWLGDVQLPPLCQESCRLIFAPRLGGIG